MMDNGKKGKGDRECRMYTYQMQLVYKDQQSYQEIGLLAVSKSCTGQSKFTVGQYKDSNFMNTRDKESNVQLGMLHANRIEFQNIMPN